MSKPDVSTAHRLRRIASTLRAHVMPGSVSDLMGMELLEIAAALEQQQVQPVQRFRPAGDAAPEVVLAADYDTLLARFKIVAADLAELKKGTPVSAANAGELVRSSSKLINAVRTINRSRHHAIQLPQDDEPVYWQRQEWIELVLGLCDQVETAAANAATKREPQ